MRRGNDWDERTEKIVLAIDRLTEAILKFARLYQVRHSGQTPRLEDLDEHLSGGHNPTGS